MLNYLKKKNNKFRILRIISTLDPKSGGPQASIVESTNALCDVGYSVDILTSDKKNYLKHKNCKFKVIKLNLDSKSYNFSFKIINWIRNNKKDYDFIIIHGIWEFNSLLARIFIKKNYYIILHGQLDPYFATATFKRIKKQIYWYLIERQNLLNSNGVFVSGKAETHMIKNTYVNTDNLKILNIGYSNNIHKIKISNKNYEHKFYKKIPILKNKKFILFLGRIDHKKGLDIMLNSILIINDMKNFYFLVAGFNKFKNKYEKDLINKINSYKKLKERVVITNFLEKDLKIAALSFCEATILPSRGENFGVSVTESLYFSKPPLITNKVGIFNEIKKYNAGIISSDNYTSIANMIKKFINLDKKTLSEYKKNSKRCFNDIFDIKEKNNKLIKIINKNVS